MPTPREILNTEATQHKPYRVVVICLALTILTVVAFWPLQDCGFINLDDDVYVYENAFVQSGLNWNGIKQAFSFAFVEEIANWHPITWLSLMLDYQIFGLDPLGYHLTNLFFHVISTVLLFLIFRRMTQTIWQSALVAALFAVHPLHVESVAWIAERKDVLSAFFWILTMGAYSDYVEYRGFRRYILVCVLFALGLMTKPMLVTLPFVLLLMDYWPLGRFREKRSDHEIQTKETTEAATPTGPGCKWSSIYPLLKEKIPLFVLAIISGIVTFIAQQQGGAVTSIEAFPMVVRIGNALVSYIAYLGKVLWPMNLAIFYPHPGMWTSWPVLGSALGLIIITTAVVRMHKKAPYLVTGWFWYTGALVPVIGIVQVGSQAMADRYTYIPLIGLFMMAAWGIPDLLKNGKHGKEILWTSAALSILFFSILTWTHVGYWKNSITLFNHALQVTDHNWFAYNNLGAAHAGLGHYRQAIENFSRAIECKPRFAAAYSNRGNAYHDLGHYRQALEDLNRAIEIDPAYAEAYNNRGNAYGSLGRYRRAIEDYGKAIEFKPDYAEAYYNRGLAYRNLGNYGEAIVNYGRAIKIKPRLAEAYYNRGLVYSILGNYGQAIADYAQAIKINPGYAEAYLNRSAAYVNSGKNHLAVTDLKTAARLGNERAKVFLKNHSISW